MSSRAADWLDLARRDAGLSCPELWVRYFGLGGMTAALELEGVLHGALTTTDDDLDRIVHALNERFTELGRNHQLPYSDSPET
jgi:hypothetical protein